MSDPLSQVVDMLQPQVRLTKLVSAAGRWGVRRSEAGQPFYCVVLEGECLLTVGSEPALTLAQGDFVLIPASFDFAMSSLRAPRPRDFNLPPVQLRAGEFRLGTEEGPPDVRYLIGHCEFGSPDAALLAPLLPRLVHVRGDPRLTMLVQLVGDESARQRPARDVVITRLLEVLLIEALRTGGGTAIAPGLVQGLSDARLAAALRRMHEAPEHPWTVAGLAQEAALSRSTFFERFSASVGMPPMEYLLAWRMALARNLLRHGTYRVAEVAERVGYGSASAFSVAFARHSGMPPASYTRHVSAA